MKSKEIWANWLSYFVWWNNKCCRTKRRQKG